MILQLLIETKYNYNKFICIQLVLKFSKYISRKINIYSVFFSFFLFFISKIKIKSNRLIIIIPFLFLQQFLLFWFDRLLL
jgi:hypothetical protein